MNIAGAWPMKLRIVGVACALLVANAACGSDSPDVNEQRPTDPAPAETPGTLGPTTTLTGTSTPTATDVPNTVAGAGTGTRGGNPSEGDVGDDGVNDTTGGVTASS